jgi:hypothetical protein
MNYKNAIGTEDTSQSSAKKNTVTRGATWSVSIAATTIGLHSKIFYDEMIKKIAPSVSNRIDTVIENDKQSPTDLELIKMLEEENEDLRDAFDELSLKNDVLRGMLAEEQKKIGALISIVPKRQQIHAAREEDLPSYNGLVLERRNGYTMFVGEKDVPPKPLSDINKEFELE